MYTQWQIDPGLSASCKNPVLSVFIIFTFHFDWDDSVTWSLREVYFHKNNNNIFQCVNSTTILLLQSYKYIPMP